MRPVSLTQLCLAAPPVPLLCPVGVEIADDTRYREGTGLSTRVARINSRWNQPKVRAPALRCPVAYQPTLELASGP